MSNHDSRPAPQTSTDRPGTDRPTATYPTADHLARLEHEEAAYLADLWADATPTEELPVARPARFVRTNGVDAPHPQLAPHVTTNAPQNEGPIQDMWRPRWLPVWHPSLMQLAIGAALVLALLGACNVAAINAHRAARNHCHALITSDWQAATRECRGTGSGTPVPEQLPSSPHTPSPAPSQAPSPPTPPAFTRVNSPSGDSPSTAAPSTAPRPAPADRPDWVTRDTHAAYDRTDPSASPLDLPRCTVRSGTSPDPSDALPCLASLSADGSRAVVLEEDASLTGLVRR